VTPARAKYTVRHKKRSQLITGSIARSAISIARSAIRRYLICSEADFEVFRPAGATRCTDGGEIWHGANFTPIGATTTVEDPKN